MLEGKGRILSFAKRSFIWDSAQQAVSVRAGEGVCAGNQAAECDAHSVFPRVLLAVPSGCPHPPGDPGVAFTAAQKSYLGLYDQNTGCHLLWAPPAKEELFSCNRKGEEPTAECEEDVRSGLEAWAGGEAVSDTGSGSGRAGRTTDGMKTHSSLLFLQGDHTDGKQAKIFQSLKA